LTEKPGKNEKKMKKLTELTYSDNNCTFQYVVSQGFNWYGAQLPTYD